MPESYLINDKCIPINGWCQPILVSQAVDCERLQSVLNGIQKHIFEIIALQLDWTEYAVFHWKDWVYFPEMRIKIMKSIKNICWILSGPSYLRCIVLLTKVVPPI